MTLLEKIASSLAPCHPDIIHLTLSLASLSLSTVAIGMSISILDNSSMAQIVTVSIVVNYCCLVKFVQSAHLQIH